MVVSIAVTSMTTPDINLLSEQIKATAGIAHSAEEIAENALALSKTLQGQLTAIVSALIQLQKYLPPHIMPVPLGNVGEGSSDAQAIAVLLNAADVAGQIERGEGTGTYTGDLNK
jgi:hypothetical protein